MDQFSKSVGAQTRTIPNNKGAKFGVALTNRPGQNITKQQEKMSTAQLKQMPQM